jgi:putative transposase
MATKSTDFRVGRHVVYLLHAHLVLVTKYRRGAITDRVRMLLVGTAREVCERHGAALIEADGEDDHLHLLIEYPPKVALSTLVGAIKTNTSKRVREQGWPEITNALWGDHFWSPSYCVLSTGGATIETIKKYIQNQREPNKPRGRPVRPS